MPSNLYGVANPITISQFLGTAGSGNITCNTGVETPIITSTPFVAVSAGYYYPLFFGNVFCGPFAAGLVNINIAARIGAGADFWGPFGVQGNYMVNGSYYNFGFAANGPPSSVPWLGAGSTISITINPTGANLFVGAAGTMAVIMLVRAPDQ